MSLSLEIAADMRLCVCVCVRKSFQRFSPFKCWPNSIRSFVVADVWQWRYRHLCRVAFVFIIERPPSGSFLPTCASKAGFIMWAIFQLIAQDGWISKTLGNKTKTIPFDLIDCSNTNPELFNLFEIQMASNPHPNSLCVHCMSAEYILDAVWCCVFLVEFGWFEVLRTFPFHLSFCCCSFNTSMNLFSLFVAFFSYFTLTPFEW